MSVKIAISALASDLETVLDENEQFIGPVVWDKLKDAYDDLDRAAAKMESEIESLKEQLEEALEKIEQLES
jgi:archaellum component FlaC